MVVVFCSAGSARQLVVSMQGSGLMAAGIAGPRARSGEPGSVPFSGAPHRYNTWFCWRRYCPPPPAVLAHVLPTPPALLARYCPGRQKTEMPKSTAFRGAFSSGVANMNCG